MKRINVFLVAIMVAAAFLMSGKNTRAFMPEQAASLETAVFAGGCFWCMEAEFDQKEGVTDVLSGYMGGAAQDASYYKVSSGDTGHIEVVQVKFNPAMVSYEALLETFWENVDPTDAEGQFCDKGSQYTAGIFYFSDAQKEAAQKSIAAVEQKLGRSVATFLREALVFYPAEESHQEYYKKNAVSYGLYKKGCGRTKRLKEVWGEKEAAPEKPAE